MIPRKNAIHTVPRPAEKAATAGDSQHVPLSDTAGLTQFDALLETPTLAARTPDRRWHRNQDEFLFMIDGHATLTDHGGAQPLQPDDAVGRRRGAAYGHCIKNRSDAPGSYLIIGTRIYQGLVRYSDPGHAMYHDVPDWRVQDADGLVLRSGKV